MGICQSNGIVMKQFLKQIAIMNQNLTSMKCLDVYLSSLNKDQYNEIKHLLKPKETSSLPLKSWGVFSAYYQDTAVQLKRDQDLKQLKQLALKMSWKNDFDAIFKEASYEALVITDIDKRIIWVNDGFVEMTGYTKKFAMNQSPSFLQGRETTEDTRVKIRNKIVSNKPFTEVITNYKKDKTPYKCELKVFPLYGIETTHYLALEKQAV